MSRCGGEALYACGQTYTVFGLIGLFERSFSNDSLVGRYLSDTALWVYLIHPPILVWVLLSCAPLGCPWWVQAPAATAVTMWVALLMFEFVVRPTPLMAIFGPAGAGRAGSPARPAPETETHLAAPSLVGIPPAKPK
jgi:glucan biosynthesis protein C